MTYPGFGPPWRIDGPPPEPPLYGLLQAMEAPAAGVREVTDADGEGVERWGNGVEVFPYPPDLPDIYDPCLVGSNANKKGFGTDVKHPQFGALTLHVDETCTASHVWDQDEYKARAVAVLAAVESAGVARELKTGRRMPNNPHFADGNGTFPNLDAATSVINGLALLEGEIAKSGRLGLIHCSPIISTLMRDRFVIDDKTGVLRTVNGTPVIPDPGYFPRTGENLPFGHPAPGVNQEWIYATGPIDIRRSEVFVLPELVSQALDRGTTGATTGRANSITYRAERYYLADWDTQVQAAVLVDRCFTTCTS